MKRATTSIQLLLILAAVLIAAQAQAMEFHVTTAEEFQAALSSAANNGGDDTILLAPGIYYGNFKYVAREPKALCIQAEHNAEDGSVTLDGKQQAYVILLDAMGLDVSFSLRHLTIQNGKSAADGGGIYTKQTGSLGSFLASNCQIRSNHALDGGGGAYLGGFASARIERSVLSDNSSRFGGGLHFGNDATLMDCIITRNSASQSGGGVHGGNNSIFTNNTISRNIVNDGGGGGVDVMDNAIFTGNRIDGNVATFDGGGIHSRSHAVYMSNTISGNSVDGYEDDGGGGGIHTGNYVYLIGNVVSGNTATYGASAIQSGYSGVLIGNVIANNSGWAVNAAIRCEVDATITNNTIVSNDGYGVYLQPGSNGVVNLYNNIIWRNGYEVDGIDAYMAGYGQESYFFNNIYSAAFAVWDNEGGNISIDPLFADADSGNFHLTVGSAAIDAGLNTAPSLPETDLDGNPRIINAVVDIGAYERSTTALHPADINGDWILEQTELTAYNEAWRTNTAWSNDPSEISMKRGIHFAGLML